VIVGADHFTFEAQFFDQRESFRFGAEKAIGTGVDGAAFPSLGLDHATHARLSFKNGAVDAGARQVIRRRKAGDSPADHYYPFRV